MNTLEDHEAEQEELTVEWEDLAEEYIRSAYSLAVCPRHEHDPELDFNVNDTGAFVTIRIWVERP